MLSICFGLKCCQVGKELMTPRYTAFENIMGKEENAGNPHFLPFPCYGRPILQAWLDPDLNTISNNCIRENSL